MTRFVWLQNTPAGIGDPFAGLGDVTVERRPQYAVSGFDGYDGVIVPMHADQRHLQGLAPRLAAFIDAGGSVLVNGHVAHPFLPQLAPFVPLSGGGLDALRIHREADHPLFDGVPTDLLTFTRGVAGFYARGGNPAPADALVIHSVGTERLPVDWLLQRPSGGRLFVHSGNDIFAFLERAGVLARFLTWFGRHHAIAGSH